MSTNFVMGITIEGIGLDATKGDGTLFTTGTPLSAISTLDVDVVDALYEEGIQSVGAESDPYLATTKSSRYTFTLHGSDKVATTFLWQQTDAPYRVGSFVSSTGSTISLTDSSGTIVGSSSMDGNLIYIGDETIRLGTWDSGTSSFTSCKRGYHSSSQEGYAEGKLVFTRIPYWLSRRVRLYFVLDDVLHMEWEGFISEAPGTSGSGVHIRFSTRHISDALKTLEVRKGYDGIAPTSTFTPVPTLYYEEIDGITVLEGELSYEPTVFKAADWNAFQRYTCFQVDQAIVASGFNRFWAVPPLLGSEFDELEESGETKAVDTNVYELFVVSPEIDAWVQERENEPLLFVSATRELPYKYHPLTAVAALLFSTSRSTSDVLSYDVLHPSMASDVRYLFSDDILEQFKETIEATPSLEVDQIILGWDGEPIKVWETCISILRQYGFFFGEGQDGKLNLSRNRLFDVDSWATALERKSHTYDDVLQWSVSSTSSLDAISAEVGPALWDEPRRVTISSEGSSSRISSLAPQRTHQISYTTFSKSNVEGLVQTLRDQAIMRYYAMPQLTIRVPSPYLYTPGTRPDLSIGSVLALRDFDIVSKWLVDNEGNRVSSLEDDVQFGGLIIKRETSTTDLSVTITMLLTNYRLGRAIRLRPPALEVTAALDPVLSTHQDSQYGSVEDDTFWFRVGDPVEVWSPSGTRLSNPTQELRIVSIGESGGNPIVNLNVWPTSGVPTGSILRLASSARWDNDNALIEGVSRPFVYVADDNGIITRKGGEQDEADIYG